MWIFQCFTNGKGRTQARWDSRAVTGIHFSNGFLFYWVVSSEVHNIMTVIVWWFSKNYRHSSHETVYLITLIPVTTTTPAPPQTPPTECLLCQCGKSNKNKIVGGTETGVNQYPWMAMLLYSNRFYCGATLINDRYVLGKINSPCVELHYHINIQQISRF